MSQCLDRKWFEENVGRNILVKQKYNAQQIMEILIIRLTKSANLVKTDWGWLDIEKFNEEYVFIEVLD